MKEIKTEFGSIIAVKLNGQDGFAFVSPELYEAIKKDVSKANARQQLKTAVKAVEIKERGYHWPYGADRAPNSRETYWQLDKWDFDKECYTDGNFTAEQLDAMYDDYLESIGEPRHDDVDIDAMYEYYMSHSNTEKS